MRLMTQQAILILLLGLASVTAQAAARFSTIEQLEAPGQYQYFRHGREDFAPAVPIADHALPTSTQVITSMAFDETATRLYLLAGGEIGMGPSNATPKEMIRVNIDTGAPEETMTLTGFVSNNEYVSGLAFGPEGQCYLSTIFISDLESLSRLYDCDATTGTLSLNRELSDLLVVDVTALCSGELMLNDRSRQFYVSLDLQSGETNFIRGLGRTYDGDQGLAYDRDRNDIYTLIRYTGLPRTYLATLELTVVNVIDVVDGIRDGRFQTAVQSTCEQDPIPVNAGMAGAWFNPDTSGQGFAVDVFEQTGLMFMAWFTHELVSSDQEGAIVGDADHRWLTAQGAISNESSVTLQVIETTGGVFNASDPVDNLVVGTLEVTFLDCRSAILSYDLYEGALSGDIPIQRIADDQVAYCRSLQDD